MSTLRIRFQTNQLTPPPYAHAISFDIDYHDKNTLVSMEVTYLDRDTLTVDEVLDEGFSENDNLKLKSILPNIWVHTVQNLVNHTQYISKETLNETEPYLEINGKYPSEVSKWVQIINELRQAVLEKAEKEAPLWIEVYRKNKTEEHSYRFEAQFAQRTFIQTVNETEVKKINWDELNNFLRDIYSAEFLYEKSQGERPKREGLFIHLGDSYWLELGKSYLIQPSKITQWLT